MSTLTPAALKQLESDGYTCRMFREGPAGSGKTTAALDLARQLRSEGHDVVIEDEIIQPNGPSAVRVWARKILMPTIPTILLPGKAN